jgi:hypothetical protein
VKQRVEKRFPAFWSEIAIEIAHATCVAASSARGRTFRCGELRVRDERAFDFLALATHN